MTNADAAEAPRPGEGAGGPGGSGATPARREGRGADRHGPLARLLQFLREVWAELRKVVRPTRGELLTYTSVVLVFVVVVMLYVSGLDYVFGQAVLWVFGGPA
ncbi:preprotein translocase subunit SecE [Pseudokineococcus basanitobsidens]|uniref:Protein translocase subunit SecE n=1 Tax=Pseudokineococcus basanitobsidens TaxID=1926649 RepID=A0ABU8RH14_9ACTN